MVQLTGNNICKRHKDLNTKVNDVIANKINFEEIRKEPETTDVDKLFKIDLAAKYKNIDYIIEILKSGDGLYVSRAIKKSNWLFHVDYSNVINTDFLHHNVFPFMSIKIKNKLLSAAALGITDENRAADFYKYCLRTKLNSTADKFLLRTSETFKLECIENDVINSDVKYLKSLIGDSFPLLEAYLAKHSEWHRSTVIREFRNMYSISDVKYLDLLEKHVKVDQCRQKELGLRMSKHIMTKHKTRVLNNPKFYVNILSESKLVRHSTPEDAKVYIVSLLPKQSSDFWDMNFYETYKSIIGIILEKERYSFFQKTFASHYPSEEFEMSKQFYEQNYYNIMTLSEQEDWALRQISSGKELLGAGRDYVWYKFVHFEKAFAEIKKYIKVATDHAKRSDIIKVLVESAKNQRELEQLLKYYYERHVNESKNSKESFLKKVISCHKAYKFDENCWAAFDKLLYSLNVYNALGHEANIHLKIVSILYHVLNKKSLPNALEHYLDNNMSSYSFKSYVDELTDEEKQLVYDYIFNFYVKRIESFYPIPEVSTKLEELKSKVANFIHFILEFMAMYTKTRDDIPESVMNFVNLDWNSFRYQQILEEKNGKEITESKLLKYLKEDANLLVENLEDLKSAITVNWHFRMNTLLKKLRTYFVDDIAKEFLKFFNELLLDKNLYHSVTSTAVYAIFQLSDETTKIEFMKKYAPESAKIDHNNVDPVILNIQEKICRFACYSRPPVPLSSMLMYLKGDYVPYCLPMFNMYLANLPQPLCLKFVESILDSPLSIQKHGLRLAFKCFNADSLTKLVLDSWKKTKNVSMRGVIYKAFFNKTVEDDSRELFDVLKTLTKDLNEDDDEEVFNVLTSNKLSREFLGEFVELVWETVQKFPNNETNLQRKRNVIRCIDNNLNLMKRDTLKVFIEENVKNLFNENVVEAKDSVAYLINTKWDLVAHYIVYFTKSEAERKESVELAKSILRRCIENWNKVVKDTYTYRYICFEFIKKLDQRSYSRDVTENFEDVNYVFEAVLEELQSSLPLYEIYTKVWKLRVKIMSRKLIEASKHRFDENKVGVINETAVIFGNEIGKLVAEFVEKKMFYSNFLDSIVEILQGYSGDLALHVFPDADVNHHDVLVSVTRGLLEYKTSETRLLALQLLPLEPDEDCDLEAYREVFGLLRDNADSELKSYLHAKYYGDCKRRRYV